MDGHPNAHIHIVFGNHRRVGELRIHYNVNDTEVLTFSYHFKYVTLILPTFIIHTYFIVWESKNNGGTLHPHDL